jgi:putative SOS response-associated peptidase YedK
LSSYDNDQVVVEGVLERALRDEPDAAPVRQLRRVQWGLVPSWAKDAKIGARMINARSETLIEKPAFKAAAAKRRCLVPMDGYFEWQNNDDKTKTPIFLHEGDELLAAARQARRIAAGTAPPAREVTKAVGNVRNNGPQLVEPVA